MAMTPKEKAQELILKYLRIENTNGWWSKVPAKQCALIAVDEILNMLENGLYDVNIRGDEYVGELNMVEYFEQVKEEIVNLK